MMRLTETVKHLIIINVIFFIAGQINENLSFSLYQKLPLFFPENPNFKFWQILTHMFMHDKRFFFHILSNMYALWIFGSALETYWGGKKFLIFYIISGLGAAFLYTLINYFQFHYIYNQFIEIGFKSSDIQDLLTSGKYYSTLESLIPKSSIQKFYDIYYGSALGASGAIYGVLVAFAFKFPEVELNIMFIPIPIKAKYLVPAVVGLDLILGITIGSSIFGSFGTGIAHFAHVGGALTGYLLMLYFNKSQFRRWN